MPQIFRFSWFGLLLLAAASHGLISIGRAAAAEKPTLLYSRYFNAQGETRYLPDGSYSEPLKRLRREFEVEVHSKPLTRETLEGVDVVLIANPSDEAVDGNPPPPHIAGKDAQILADYVQNGGGLILMANQENHNFEVADTNKLLEQFGLQFVNLHTDAKRLRIPETTPLLGGLVWAYYTGNSVAVATRHAANPRALVVNDLTQKPVGGERDQKGALLAVAEPGEGRVVLVTDSGWIANPVLAGEGLGGVAIKDDDNWEIFMRLVRWAAYGATAEREAK